LNQIRLQKYLAQCGIASRRKAERLIKQGEVSVNGETALVLGVRVNPDQDEILIQGRPLKLVPKGIILLNKPRGVVSTLSDPNGRRCIAHYLTKHFKSYFPVGRLDTDSSGLIILTNDGDLAERLLHPRFELQRRYLCEIEGFITSAVIQRLESGVRLHDGIAHADIELSYRDQNSSKVFVTVKEGRNRLVRRMFEKIGHPVLSLKRLSHGPFRLGGLKSGEIQKLSEREYWRMRASVMGGNGGMLAHG